MNRTRRATAALTALTAVKDAEWNAALDKAAQIARGNGAYATAHAILAHKRK